ncbi:hypothetical protein HDU86_007822 [Geranomyces michiganensis]|nr:hypothetical protein HDU86_007822 [Geranomyces michiganensis]
MSTDARRREGRRGGHSRAVSVSLIVVSLAALVSATPVNILSNSARQSAPAPAPAPLLPLPLPAPSSPAVVAKRQAAVYFPSTSASPAVSQSIPISATASSQLHGVVVINAPQSVLAQATGVAGIEAVGGEPAAAIAAAVATPPAFAINDAAVNAGNMDETSPPLTVPAIIGLAGAVVIALGVLVAVYWFCRSRRGTMTQHGGGRNDHPPPADNGSTGTPAGRMMTTRDAIRVAHALLPSSRKQQQQSNNNSSSSVKTSKSKKLFGSAAAEITTPQGGMVMMAPSMAARYPLRPESGQDLPVADFLLPDIVRLSALRGGDAGAGEGGEFADYGADGFGGGASPQPQTWGYDYRAEFGDERVYPTVPAPALAAAAAAPEGIAGFSASSLSNTSSSQNSRTNLLLVHEYDLAPPAAPLFRYPESTITPPPPPPPRPPRPAPPAPLHLQPPTAPPRRSTRSKTPTTTTFSTTSSTSTTNSSSKRQQQPQQQQPPRTPLTSQRSIHIYTAAPRPPLQHVVIDHRPLSARSADSVSVPTTELGSRFSAITEASLSRYLDEE